MLFPTGKPHISYSEIKVWKECSYRHKLAYIDKLDTYENNPYADFGTAVHNAIEHYLKTKTMDLSTCLIEIDSAWVRNDYDGEEYKKKMAPHSWWKGEPVEVWQSYAKTILEAFPNWIDNEFPNWEFVAAEHQLYELIEGEDIKFKGFVDCMIKAKNKQGKDLLWVIDWKTTGKAGWMFRKKREFIVLAQIGLYKTFLAKKLDLPLKDVRCAYVFLKRGAKPEKCIELFPVSVGPKFVEKTDKLVNSMVKSVQKGLALRNYNSCKFCPFASSEYCNGQSW